MMVLAVLILAAFAVPISVSTVGQCSCSNGNVDIATALANPTKDSLCRFAGVYLDCLMNCDPTTANLLQAAIDAVPCVPCGGAETMVMSVLCLIIPILQTLL